MLDLRQLLVVGALALATSVDAQAKCAKMPLEPAILTKANAEVGPGGGVVVGLAYGKYGKPSDRKVEHPEWRFKQGGKLVEPKITLLAPSLALYELAGDSAALVDDKQKSIRAVRRGKPKPALAAPTIKSATGKVTDDDGERWGAQYGLTIDAGALPADATGVIVYVAGKAVNWAIVDPKAALLGFSAGGHCANDLPGTSVPTSGDITIAWFDTTGRVSAQSKPITIKKG